MRGDYENERDLDVVPVLRQRTPEIEKAFSRLAWEVGSQVGYVVSTHDFTLEELQEAPLRASPVHREGARV